MEEPRSGSRQWSVILLPAIVAVLILLALAVCQHCMPAELLSPEAAPSPTAQPVETGLQPPARDCLFPGSGTDLFGECPDPEGYYSSRRHFDLASSDRIRRALVMVEKDEDRTLHLRLSKADLDEMPTVEEVLPLVGAPPAESEGRSNDNDPLLPHFALTRSEFADEGIAGIVERKLTPPLAGFELRLIGDEFEEPLELQSVESATGRVLWREPSVQEAFPRIEFLPSNQAIFFLHSDLYGGAVFDLRKGLRCRYQRGGELRSGFFPELPLFLAEGREFQFAEGDTLWRVDLSDCRRRAVGKIPASDHELSQEASLEKVATSSDGAVVVVEILEWFSRAQVPRDPDARRALFLWLEYDGERYVEKRRVAVRAHNALSGFAGLSWEMSRNPLLVATYCQDFNLDSATGRVMRSERTGPVSHVLIRNRHGNTYALRTPASKAGLAVDSRSGLLKYAGRWWDLKVLDRPLESDLQ